MHCRCHKKASKLLLAHTTKKILFLSLKNYRKIKISPYTDLLKLIRDNRVNHMI